MVALALTILPTQSATSADAVPTPEELEGLPKGIMHAIATVESSNNPSAVHRNDGKGDSLGLNQIKLSTARLMGFRGTRKQLMRASVNSLYAATYLKHQIKRYGGNLSKAVTAYNAGSTYSHGGSLYLTKVFNEWAAAR